MDLLSGWGDEIARGVLVTVEVSLLSVAFGLLWGILGAIARLSPYRVLRFLADSYTTVIRGTPELLIILIVYFGGTVALTAMVQRLDASATYVEVPALAAGVFALSLVFGGYAAEVIRGAFLAVPIGQIEAGKAVGMSAAKIFLSIKLPLMWRFALPGLGNIWISLVKDTALISIVGLEELMRVSYMATSVTQDAFRFYAVAAAIYLALTAGNTWILERLEAWTSRGERRL